MPIDKKEINKKYRRRHKEQIRIRNQEYYQKKKTDSMYREKRRGYVKKWKKNNPEKNHQWSKIWRQRNPEKVRQYKEDYREKHKIKKRIREKGMKGEEKIKILKMSKGNKCQSCGYEESQILVFHHLRDKKFTIGSEKKRCIEQLKEEADKCLLLCPNCHALIHLSQRSQKENNKLKH